MYATMSTLELATAKMQNDAEIDELLAARPQEQGSDEVAQIDAALTVVSLERHCIQRVMRNRKATRRIPR